MIRAREIVVWLGGGALVFACLANSLSVIGRHIGLPLHGAIELVQAAVLLAGSLALVMATADAAHARVRVLVDRLPAGGRRLIEYFAMLSSMMFFAGLLVGGIWIARDMWNGFEVSEVLGLPWAALRLFANLALLVTVFLCLRAMARARR